MTVKHVYTCTQCQKEVTVDAGDSWGFGGTTPSGWLTVGGMGPIMTGDTPGQYAKKQPHLCSWPCLAKYAEKMSKLIPL